VNFPHLDGWSEARQQKATRYDELFADTKVEFELTPPFVGAYRRHIFHQYVIRVARYRDELINH
jgi:dTDP-4-amino-4,6-dideoxygalactose transaminase